MAANKEGDSYNEISFRKTVDVRQDKKAVLQ